MHKAVFLDRDGVINKAIVKDGKPFSPLIVEDLKVDFEVKFALDELRNAGFLLVVITNQPEIARGNLTFEVLDLIHDNICKSVGHLEFYVCPHDNQDLCKCRKPSTGLLDSAAINLRIDLIKSYLIGDRWNDIAAGQRAGCKVYWINRNYDEKQPTGEFITVNSLSEAVSLILSENII